MANVQESNSKAYAETRKSSLDAYLDAFRTGNDDLQVLAQRTWYLADDLYRGVTGIDALDEMHSSEWHRPFAAPIDRMGTRLGRFAETYIPFTVTDGDPVRYDPAFYGGIAWYSDADSGERWSGAMTDGQWLDIMHSRGRVLSTLPTPVKPCWVCGDSDATGLPHACSECGCTFMPTSAPCATCAVIARVTAQIHEITPDLDIASVCTECGADSSASERDDVDVDVACAICGRAINFPSEGILAEGQMIHEGCDR